MAKTESYTSLESTEHGLHDKENQNSPLADEIRKQIISWWFDCVYSEEDIPRERTVPLKD